MKRMMGFAAWLALAWLFLSSAYGAETIWVASGGTKLKADPSASSKTISELAVGTELKLLQSESRWYQVRTALGKQGWVYRGKVSTVLPQQETQDSGNPFAGLGGSNISADEAQTARSIRGLSPEAEQYAKQRGTPQVYQKALDEVLALIVTTGELEAFLQKGKIGEYAQ